MLLLVLAHRHKVGVHDQNVRGHQDGIGEESMRRLEAMRHLVLVAVAALKQTHRRETGKIPCELLDLRHVALAVDHGLRGVESASEIVERHVARGLAEGLSVADCRHRVEIRDEHEIVALLLEVEHRLHRAEIVAPMQFARGLDACQNSHNSILPNGTP